MAYELGWIIPGKMLRLQMTGDLSLDAFVAIDGQINEHLRQRDAGIVLVIDASEARVAAYGIERIRASQTYLNSSQICQLIVISNNKLNRLAMLLLFNLCRPRLRFCNDFDQARRFLEVSKVI